MNPDQPIKQRATLTDQLRLRAKVIIDPIVDVLARYKLCLLYTSRCV